jgi:hypothetical protein
MGANQNSSRRRWTFQQDEHDNQAHLRLNYPSWSRPRSHWSANGPRNQHTVFRTWTQSAPHRSERLLLSVRLMTPVRLVNSAGQAGGKKQMHSEVPESLPKSPKRRHGKDTSKPWVTMSNYLYIPKRFIQGLSCRLIILPSHKISPWSSQASPRNSKGKKEGKMGKLNEVGFPKMVAILSPLGFYGGHQKTKIPLLAN